MQSQHSQANIKNPDFCLTHSNHVFVTELLLRISFQSAMNSYVSLHIFSKGLECMLISMYINIGRFKTDSTDGLWSQLHFG